MQLTFIAIISASNLSAQDSKINKYGLTVIKTSHEYSSDIATDSVKKMIDLKRYIPNITYDLRYATEKNFLSRKMYAKNTEYTFLRCLPVLALANVQKELNKRGLGLKIWDAYRPYSVTEKFWELVKDERYAANPTKGSGHNRGIAVDLTIIDITTGKELDFGTDFDNFTDTAHHSFVNLPEEVLKNRRLLKQTMEKYGFKALDTEWWHYSWPNDRNYAILDLGFEFLGSYNYEIKSKTGYKDSGKNNYLRTQALPCSSCVTTALSVEPLKTLPNSFFIDSIFNKDPIVKYVTALYFPVSVNNNGLNKIVKQFVTYQAIREKPLKKENNQIVFNIWPVDVTISRSLFHCLFIEQSFTEGAAHYVHGYSTLNYDVIKKKRVSFTDLFTFSSKKDKQSFCDIINEFNESNGYLLTPKDLRPNMDFQISNERLTLYFDDFEKEPSMGHIGVDISKIKKYFNPIFRASYSNN